jgi:hypothetical protein
VSIAEAAKRRAKREKAARSERARGATLCGRGFHKWRVDPRQQFDVQEGRLVTRYLCERCGAVRTTLE